MTTCTVCKSAIEDMVPYCPFCGEPTGTCLESENFAYEAFISYRHLPLSSKVARRLQRDLEGFPIPKGLHGIGSGKRLGRLFRDEDELPASTSLSDQIRDALAQSRFLIVVCTPETKESRWVELEIELFASLHGRDHILVALAEGERSRCLPDILLFKKMTAEDDTVVDVPTEPLAADFRESSCKSRKTETMRIAAALLGCGLDDLRQRERIRKNAVAARIAIVIAVVSTAFAGVTLHQQRQILDKQHSLQISQSQLLATESENLLAGGRRQEAILTALEALPKDSKSDDRPLVPEAQRALEDATGAYATREGWIPLFTRTLDVSLYDMAIDDQEGKLAAIDSNNVVHFYDLKSGERLSEVELPGPSNIEGETRKVYYEACFCTHGLLTYRNYGHDIWCFDPVTGTMLWHYESPLGDEWSLHDVAVSPNGSLACCVGRYYHTEDYFGKDDLDQLDADEIVQLLAQQVDQEPTDVEHTVILDLHDGSESASLQLDRDRGEDVQCTFDGDGGRIGVSLDGQLHVIDLKTLNNTVIQLAHPDLHRFLWLSDSIVVASIDVPESDYPCSIQRFSLDGKELWRVDDYLKPVLAPDGLYEGKAIPWTNITAPDTKTELLLASLGEKLVFVDMESGNTNQIASYESPIGDVLVTGDESEYRIHVLTYSGTVQYLSYFEKGLNVGSALDTRIASYSDGGFIRLEGTIYLATRTGDDDLRGKATAYTLHGTSDLRKHAPKDGEWAVPEHKYGEEAIAALSNFEAADDTDAHILAQASFAIDTPDRDSVIVQSGGYLYLFDKASWRKRKQSLEPYEPIWAASFSDGGRLFSAQCEIPGDYKGRTSLHVFDLSQKALSPQSVITYGVMLSPDAGEVLLDDQSTYREPMWTMPYLSLDELVKRGKTMTDGFELADSQLYAISENEL